MEKWKKLPYSGKKGETYEVSNKGNMRKWHPGEKKPQALRGSNIKGYKVFNTKLSNGKGTSLYIHKLIAQQFLKQPSANHKFVAHKDYDKDNNASSNLKWMTREELNKHHKKNPNILNMVRPKGLVRYSKLTEADVKKIKKKFQGKGKIDWDALSKQYGVTAIQLKRIKAGKNWAHVTV